MRHGNGAVTRATQEAAKQADMLEFRGTWAGIITVKVLASNSFASILRTFSDIRYPACRVDDERITFAVLEMVSNSVRAHREAGVDAPVVVRLRARGGRLHAVVMDRGGGFDPSRLPYDLGDPPDVIDMTSPAFAAYRDRYDGARFGMGLVAARRVFPEFSLNFVDDQRRRRRWPDPGIVGTVVSMAMPLSVTECVEVVP